MSFRVVVNNSSPASASPYRLVDDRGRELTWANQFLDAQRLRQLSLRSLRAMPLTCYTRHDGSKLTATPWPS